MSLVRVADPHIGGNPTQGMLRVSVTNEQSPPLRVDSRGITSRPRRGGGGTCTTMLYIHNST